MLNDRSASHLRSAFEASVKTDRQKTKARLAPFSLRLSKEEREQLSREANGKSLGGYIKSRLFNPTRPTRSELAKTLGLLGQSNIVRNLEHLAAEARAGSLLLDEQTLLQIEEACAYIAEMRGALIKALGLVDGGSR